MEVLKSPLGRIMTSFSEFKIPQTPKEKDKAINYDAVIGGDLQPEVRKMLQVASQQRVTLIQGLSYGDAAATAKNIIAATEAYLPSVWRIQKSLEFSESTKIHLEKPLQFVWTGILTPEPRTTAQGVFVFEVAFVLVIRGIAQYNAAKEALRDLSDGSTTQQVIAVLKVGMKELRIGAGIFEFLATSILPNWRNPPPVPPTELTVPAAKAMATYCLCMAQRLMITAALIKGSPQLLPRLFGGLKEKYDIASRTIQSLEGWERRVIPFLHEEPQFVTSLCNCQMMKYKAVALHDTVVNETAPVDSIEDTFGQAVAYMNVALGRAKQTKLPGSMKNKYGNAVGAEIGAIKALYKEYNDENNSIYFGRYDSEEIEDMSRSQHIFNIAPIPFNMPAVNPLSFEEIPKPEGWGEPVRNFDTTKHQNEMITDDGTFIPPGVDPNVFKGLPENVKNEIVEEFFAEQERKAKKGGKKKRKQKKR